MDHYANTFRVRSAARKEKRQMEKKEIGDGLFWILVFGAQTHLVIIGIVCGAMKNDTIVEQLGGGNVIVADWKDPSSASPHTHETVPCIFSKDLYHICLRIINHSMHTNIEIIR